MHFFEKFKFCPSCGSSSFVRNDSKSKRCHSCEFVYYLNPSAATAAFILNEKDELLVCRRANEPAKGTYDLPGGFSDLNETSEENIAREIFEELGVKADSIRYLFTLPNEYLYSNLIVPTIDVFFQCTLENYTNITVNDDVDAFYFIPIKDLDATLFGLTSIKKAIIRLKEDYLNLNNK